MHHPCATFYTSTAETGLNRETDIPTNKEREKGRKKETYQYNKYV